LLSLRDYNETAAQSKDNLNKLAAKLLIKKSLITKLLRNRSMIAAPSLAIA
jgi:hypothetical protein